MARKSQAALAELSVETRSRLRQSVQQRIYAALLNHSLKTGDMPTRHETSDLVGITSMEKLTDSLHAIVCKGYLRYVPHACRGIRFAETIAATPLIGTIVQGALASPYQVVETGLVAPAQACYAVRVADDALAPSLHLCAGDLLFIRPGVGRREEYTLDMLLVVSASEHAQGNASTRLVRRASAPPEGVVRGVVTQVLRLPQRTEGTRELSGTPCVKAQGSPQVEVR